MGFSLLAAELPINTSPTLHKLSNMLNGFSIESFGKVICPLFFCVDFQHINLTILHMTPEEVPLNQEVLRAVGDSLFGGEEEGSIVVFEDATLNSGLELGRKVETADDLDEHGAKWKERPHAGAECGILGFEGRK